MEHQKQWDFLKQKFQKGQLAHAYIFSGNQDADVARFTKRFIASLEQEHQKAFSALIEKEQFPDLLLVRSSQSESSQKNEKDMLEIDVDQIRQVNTFLSYTPYYGGYKTVIIEHAERLNKEAQSCLLKTLEEPRGKTLVLLLCEKPDLLLPTILSRCQTVKFFSGPADQHQVSPEEKRLVADLEVLLKSDLASKFSYAKKIDFDTQSLEQVLGVWQRHFRQLLLAHFGLGHATPNTPPPEKLKNILRSIEVMRFQAITFNVNAKLALESLLLEL